MASLDNVGTSVVSNSSNWDTAYATVSGGSGKLLQSVYTSIDEESFSTTSTTMTNITTLTAAITPSSTSNKILIHASVTAGGSPVNTIGIGLKRDSTQIGSSTASTHSQHRQMIAGSKVHDDNTVECISFIYEDSPATTSSITYVVTVTNRSGYTFYLNRPSLESNVEEITHGISWILAQEIAG